MLTTVVIIAIIIALIIGVLSVRNKAKKDPNSPATSARPDAPPGYNTRSNDPSAGGTGPDPTSSRS